jgi:signal transduction histidine kinase
LLLSLFTNRYLRIQPSINYQQKQLQSYIWEQEKDAQQLLKDTALLRKLVLNTESIDEFKRVYNKKYGLFLFAETISESQDMLFWNNQKIVPPEADFSLKDSAIFQKLPNGYYVVIKNTLRFSGMSNNILSYTLIPVLSKFYLEGPLLQTQFAHDKEAVNKIAITEPGTVTPYPIKGLDGKTLFHIKRLAHSHGVTDNVTIILRLLALLLLLVFLQLTAEDIARKKGSLKGIVFLLLLLVACRAIMYMFPGIFSFRQFQLFDPTIYANNWLNRSLGDLLINAIILCWLVLFTWDQLYSRKRLPALVMGKARYAFGTLAVFFLILSTFQLATVVHSLVADSKVSFNVSDFFSLDLYSVFGFIILAIISVTYYYFSRLLYQWIFQIFQNHLYVYFAIAIIGLFFLTLRGGHQLVLFELPVLLWLVVYTLLLSQQHFVINRLRVTVAGVLFWIFVFSASLAVLILQGNHDNEAMQRKAIAKKLDIRTDPSSEITLSINLAYIDNRFLSNNFERFKDPDENRIFRDSLLAENIKSYYRYDTKIYVFDKNNQQVNNDDTRSFADLNTILTSQSKPTGTPGLYYHDMSFDRFAYITKKVINDSTGFLGTFFIISTPKQYGTTDAFYPELFRQMNRNDVENSPVYSYAIYKSGLMMTSSGKYPFPITITDKQVPKDEFDNRDNNDFDELWYRAGNKKTIVVAKKQDPVIESITLFSYLFCAFLFMVGVLKLLSFLLQMGRERKWLNIFSGMSIRTQIHGTVIFVSVLSFIIIGAATISFFIDRYKRNNIDRLSRTAAIAVKEVEKKVTEANISTTDFDFYDSTSYTVLNKLMQDIADIHNVDVNLYDLQGNLEVSSDENVYDKGILSNKMHPLAFYHLNNMREVQRVQEENISNLQYLSIYTAIRNRKEGKVYAYLNIPYFSSQIDLKQEISNFLVTLINLNAFIFLIAGIIALFITNKITASFSVISDKMRAITLGGRNEEIVWNKNDEIGELVKQYNKMVHELEKSAEALAKSEREGAWREMARQVAHEIKNPLTPMKLSIQYLQKAINSNNGNIKDLTASVANTLIEQIDHLSKIASDFSQFANIGNKKIQLVDLHNVVGSLVELYNSNPKVDISWNKLEGSVVMKTDKTHMNRLFTNLLTNAVDACYDREKCMINITEEKRDHSIIVALKDNGEGIPEDMRSRIFIPNFTTKSSGTGLGLAMCKTIVEQAGGQIWFETKEGRGTTFFVELPVVS